MVMISHQRRFIFLKTRKTGSTSIEMMLEPWCAPPDHVVAEATHELVTDYGIVGARIFKSSRDATWRHHLAARHVEAHLGEAFWNDYVKLTSVRHPFARCVSLFYWRMSLRDKEMPTGIDDNRARFREFVFEDKYKSDFGITHVRGRYAIDDAFRLEHLNEDLERIGGRLGLPLSSELLPHTKDSGSVKPNVDPRALFDPDLVDEIKRKDGWVFEHFGYSDRIEDAPLRRPATEAEQPAGPRAPSQPQVPPGVAWKRARREPPASAPPGPGRQHAGREFSASGGAADDGRQSAPGGDE